MENRVKINKYIVIFGRVVFFIWIASSSLRLFFRNDYTKEMDNEVTKVLLILFGLYFLFSTGYQLKYNKENFIVDLKTGFKKSWPQIFFIIALLLLWFMYKRSLA